MIVDILHDRFRFDPASFMRHLHGASRLFAAFFQPHAVERFAR